MVNRTYVITRFTFLEATRRKIVLAALILGAVFLLFYGFGFHFLDDELPKGNEPREALMRSQLIHFLTTAGLYGVNFLTIALGALLASDTLAGEITSGTIQTIASKPIRRMQIVLGKWLAFATLLFIYLMSMGGTIILIVYLQSGYAMPHFERGLILMYLSTLVIMTLSLWCSSRFPALATGGIVFGAYGLAHVGGWVEQIGSFMKNETATNIGILSSLLMPSESLWRRATYEMSSTITRALGFNGAGPFATVSIPNPAMIVYAGLYLSFFLIGAIRHFSRRDL